jgi:VWFA-related protein
VQRWLQFHGFGQSLPGLAGTLFLAVGSAPAQAPPAAEAPEVSVHESGPPFQIRVETNLVTVRTVVRDAKGRPVGGLRKEDFRLFDEGKPREITGFAVETAVPRAAAAPPAQPVANPAPETAVAPAPAAAAPQRFVALYFDDLHMDFGAVGHTRDAAWLYISTALRPEDRVAIFTSSNQGAVDFTADRAKLHDALFRLTPHSRTNPVGRQCPAIGEYQAFLIDQRHDPSAIEIAAEELTECRCAGCGGPPRAGEPAPPVPPEEIVHQAAAIWNLADMQSLDALEVADGVVRRLAAMPGERLMVLVSTGFLSATRQREVDALIDRAVRQNVVINALDAAGLYTKTLSANEYLVGRPDLLMAKSAVENEGLTVERDVMAGLAAGTGGIFFHNSNDFNGGFREAAQVPEICYVLSFSAAEVKMDGKFHALRVTVNNSAGWDIQARRGYFAIAETPPIKSELESLVFSQEERKELAATVTPQPEASGVTVKIHVDIRALAFRKEADRNINTLTFDTVLFDPDGKYVAGKESSLEFRLPDGRLEALRQSGINAQTNFRVAPGAYRIREVVRDSESKEMAALNSNVEVSAAPPVQAAVLPAAPARPAKHKKAKQAKSIIDWSVAEFVKAMPELSGLEPAENQERLPFLLEETSQNVKSFFDALPEITAHERIDMEWVGWAEHRKEEFNYLALSRPCAGCVAMEEFRTNAAGKRVEPQGVEHGFVTKGFVSMVVHFDPSYLSESVFRYLGRQDMDGHPTDVVCFAQIPGKARVKESLKTDTRSLSILIQGVAWIDTDDYHIVRMRTEKLEPYFDPDLKAERTVTRFTEVRLNSRLFWLPEEVTVTVIWHGAVFRNVHYYSQFKLFGVDTQVKWH